MMLIIKTLLQLIPFILEAKGKSTHGRQQRWIVLVLFLLLVMSGGTIIMGERVVTVYKHELECIDEMENLQDFIADLEDNSLELTDALEKEKLKNVILTTKLEFIVSEKTHEETD